MGTLSAWRKLILCGLAIMALLLSSQWATAGSAVVRDLPPGLEIPAAALPGPAFDVDRATQAYVDLLSPAQRALSDRYFEGGYWLQLWETLWTVAACALMVTSGLSRRMRDWSQRVGRSFWISTSLYAAQFVIALFILQMPLSIYTDFIREHQYALSEQSFGGWLSDQLVLLPVAVILGAVAATAIYAAVRRTGSRWWQWATALSFVLLMIAQLLAPVYVFPLVNDYKPLPPGPVKEAVFSLARANQVPTDHVEWFNASKQTTRVSANVAGLFGTARVALNDNLLNKSTLPEIKAVLGHEMGHYVLNHEYKESILLALVLGVAFGILSIAFDWALARWSTRYGFAGRADPAALPVAIALLTLITFLLTPLQNWVVRSYESEADAFGLNASREPYGWAMAAMRLSTYRKIQPSAIEELIFYDHPSGYERVRRGMIWQKENQVPAVATTGRASAPSP